MAGSEHGTPRALILGHSYVRRLGEFCRQSGYENLGFNMDVQVHFHGLSGARVAGMWDTLGLIHRIHPDSITLQIGGNDLPSLTPSVVAHDILQFVDFLSVERRIPRIFVCSLLPRFSADDEYNLTLVPATNQILESKLNAERLFPGVQFWYHARGLNSLWADLYLSDGVHLSPLGLRKYFKNMRGTVIPLFK